MNIQPSDALLRRAARWLTDIAYHLPQHQNPTREEIHATQEWKDGQELYAIIRARKMDRAELEMQLRRLVEKTTPDAARKSGETKK